MAGIDAASFPSVAKRAARWAGLSLNHDQLGLLANLADWLVKEAIPAGGLGPAEGAVIYPRHIADSLLFAAGWHDASRPPGSLLDVGAGVGLPGLPLAIAWPSTQVTLLDRSSRRADLARRAVRLLRLSNVEVVTAQLREWRSSADFIVCRAVASPATLRRDFARLLNIHGVAVAAGSTRRRSPVPGYHLLEVPTNIIGKPVWLLIMGET